MAQAQSYTFDANAVRLPLHISLVLSRPIRAILRKARDAASEAFQELRLLESYWEDRFHHLCPKDDQEVFEQHIKSVDLLLDWSRFHKDRNGTVAATPKMPKTMFHFQIDEDAYEGFVWEYDLLHRDYLNGSFFEWTEAKAEFEHALAAYDEISPANKQFVEEWWDGFVGQMENWVCRIDDLCVPAFDDVMDEFRDLVLERIDVEGEWDFVC